MKMKSFFMAIALLCCVLTIQAEEQKKTVPTGTTQTAITSDGRKVILKSDGTWEYYKEPAPAVPQATLAPVAPPKEVAAAEIPQPAPAVPVQKTVPTVPVPKDVPKGTLSFTAVLFPSASAKPIGGQTFYLLDNDLNAILQTSNVKPQKGMSLLNTFSTLYYGSSLGVQKSAKAFDSAMQSIKPHIVATATTDADGKGQFPSIAAGAYYMMNVSVIFLNTGSLSDRKAVLWNTKVQIQPGQNSITLDEKNALL